MVVDQLTRVLLNMDAQDADLSSVGELDIAMLAQRLVVLADLIRLGQIGIAIVLSVHLGDLGDLTVGGKTRHDRVFHHALIELGQCTGQTDTHGTAMGIGVTAEFGGAGAEDLGVRLQFYMGLKARY